MEPHTRRSQKTPGPERSGIHQGSLLDPWASELVSERGLIEG
jgi:hypothetical protein